MRFRGNSIFMLFVSHVSWSPTAAKIHNNAFGLIGGGSEGGEGRGGKRAPATKTHKETKLSIVGDGREILIGKARVSLLISDWLFSDS